jgi:N-ethylmaleimide reductase
MPTILQPIPTRLFEPLQLGRYTLSNRIVMAPMTRCRATEVNIPSTLASEYYAQRASAGLIVTEATQPSVGAQGYWRTPGIHNDRQSEVWARIAERVHAAGGRIFMQMWHNGRIFHPDNSSPGVQPVAPSAIAANIKLVTPNGMQATTVPIALDQQGIAAITEDFVAAARRAVDCGIDGVEIHAANGYLFDQFLNRSSNHRTDAWGGTIENRARMLMDTTSAVCSQIGSDRVAVRISPLGIFNDVNDPEPELTYRYVARELSALDLAYLHVIRPNVSGSLTRETTDIIDPLPEIRALYQGTLIVAGDLDVNTADQLVDGGIADGVGFGRWFISNPDLPARLRHGWPLEVPDRTNFYSGEATGYVDYPAYVQQSRQSEA